MNISVVGTGYVGLVTAACLAKLGHKVSCVDVDEDKIRIINSGESPIYEAGLGEIISGMVPEKLSATANLEKAVLDSEVTFICVGTPSKKDGSIDLSHVGDVCRSIGAVLSKKNGFHVVVVKSTVVPGTTDCFVTQLLEKMSGKKSGGDFGVAMNPEFLREGVAVKDFLNPDRIVVGTSDERTRSVLDGIYGDFDCKIVYTDPTTAEMIKYVCNSFLATKLSFINEVGNICKKLGVDVYDVAEGIGLDHRISPAFLKAGPGFGGSCFPKDVLALIKKAREVGGEPLLLERVIEVNERQPKKVLELIRSKITISGAKIGVLGLAFKAGTDDMRQSPTIPIIEGLVKEGAIVLAYDPQAMDNAKKIFGENITYSTSAEELLEESENVLVLTEWGEFRKLDYSRMRGGYLFDARKIVDKDSLPKKVKYEGLSW
ncbi:MAG TPA: UDP-glucose/GDP-mannose dehydrogenase family protein [Candidatus Altiarchaeales archaeon]|nr:UDP-glucose/GDP-mannose dehydrogenase family protein [Candidatus Altiarchaeales archaeon]